jgi:lipopolysaccharide transport system ATP-binding protein
VSETAIRVENLGKLYRIGEHRALSDFRETVRDAIRRGRTTKRPVAHDLWALKDVGFEIKCGEVVGILGDNGSGKTTLLKVLAQITPPTEGRAEICGRIGALLDVGAGLHGELTGRENVYLNGAVIGMTKREIERAFDAIVDFAELATFIDTPLKRYSSGMCVRLAFSVAAHLECDAFLVDEVLAVGDVSFQAKCMNRMVDAVKTGRTIVFVSHDLEYMRQLCNRIIVFSAGRIVFDGSAAAALDYYSSPSTCAENTLSLAQ